MNGSSLVERKTATGFPTYLSSYRLFIRAWPVVLGGLARVCEVARVGCVTLDDGSQRTSSVENGSVIPIERRRVMTDVRLTAVDLWSVLRTPRGGVVSLPYVYGTVLVAMFGSRLDRRCLPEELATARRPKTVVKNTRYSSHGSEA